MTENYTLGEIQVALTPQARFEEYLQSRGMRNTEQRASWSSTSSVTTSTSTPTS